MNSGSYYDKTKIRKPDEYDCMFSCLIRSKCVYHPISPSKSYAGLKTRTSANWEPSELLSPSDDKPFICPKAFKAYVRQHVETVLLRRQPRGKQIVIRQDDGNGPAITLDVKHSRSHQTVFSVDIVPAVRLLEWPSPAQCWTSNWLLREHTSKIKEPEYHDTVKPFMVPKIHPTEYVMAKHQCRWWRLSFSAAEKEILKHADGIHSQSDSRTCRKDVLRLLKDDLATFYENNKLADKSICSYFIKTIVLHLLEDRRKSWADSDLLQRYVDGLQSTLDCLKDRNIEHYFIKGENLLDEKEISEENLNKIEVYFRNKLTYYSSYR